MDYKTFEKGNNAFANNDYKKALAYYSSVKVSIDDDDYPILKLRLAESYYRVALFQDAVNTLKDLLQYFLSKLSLDKSIAVCKKILQIDPDDVETIQTMASLLSRTGQKKEAIKYYKLLAVNYEYIGSIEKAIESIETLQSLGQYDADKILEQLINRYKDKIKSDLLKNLSKTIKELKKFSDTDFLSVAYSFKLGNDKYDPKIAKELILLFFKSGNLYRALSLSLYALSKNFKDLFFQRILLKILLALGYKDELTELIEYRVLKIDKGDLHSIENILKSIQRMGVRLPDEVYDDEKTVIVSAPRDEYAREFNDAKILVAEALYDDALNILSSLLVRYPDDDVVRQYFREVSELSLRNTKVKFKKYSVEEAYNELETLLGDIEVKEKQEQISFLEDILNIKMSTYTLYHLAISLLNMELWFYSSKAFTKILTMEKRDSVFYKDSYILGKYTSAMAYLSSDSPVMDLKKFIDREQDEEFKLSAMYYLALVFEARKEKNGAITIYREILAIRPSYKDVDIRLSSIAR